jgi:hypothetical protein
LDGLVRGRWLFDALCVTVTSNVQRRAPLA